MEPRRSRGAGWGLFNLVEGMLDHQRLQLHHVHEYGNQLLWDLVFLASGMMLIAVDLGLNRAVDLEARTDPMP